jgi:hypothetical protein
MEEKNRKILDFFSIILSWEAQVPPNPPEKRERSKKSLAN